MIVEKRPREYAMDILRLSNKKEMQDYLAEQVPEKYHEWVKNYVRIWWPIRSMLVDK